MFWVGTPYFLVVLGHVSTSSIISLVIRVVGQMNKYLTFHIYRFSGQLVALLGLNLDKGVCWKPCGYQSGSKLVKLACVKIWWHLA
jgi:hypothetical protein